MSKVNDDLFAPIDPVMEIPVPVIASDLTITIAGRSGVGKTTAMHLLAAVLSGYGIKLTIEGNDERRKTISQDDLHQRLLALRDKTILIREVQTRKALS